MSVEDAVESAKPAIVRALAPRGVTGLMWFAAYEVEPVVWLVTDTDAAKQVVEQHECFWSVVQELPVDFGTHPGPAALDALDVRVVTAGTDVFACCVAEAYLDREAAGTL